ncbi:MAG: hypothetical protein ACI84K_000344 [Pseudohongiellaceae bacterium]|jgi:hypothetical protein
MFRKKKKQDVRFLPYEEYRTTSQNDSSKNHEVTHAWMNSGDALKVTTESSDSAQKPILSINQFLSDSDEFTKNNEVDSSIHVESEIHSSNISNNKSISNIFKAEQNFSNSLGVFSDTKIYSALISSELRQHNTNLKYFNHPKNFISSQYSFFDNVTAWIVFLSEETDERFLETFIDRYIDKPCLFLFAKGNRNKTGQKVSRFLVDNHLITSEYSTLLSEV